MKRITLLPLLIAGVLSLSSLKPKRPQPDKSVTKALDGKFALVPSGMAVFDGKSVSVQAFYVSKTEVTNKEYGEFLADLAEKGETEKLAIARVDSTAWSTYFNFHRPMTEYYHVHPAYADYPVVNISCEAAELYCTWLTEKLAAATGRTGYRFRLPERAEFIRAACGDASGRPYAWKGYRVRDEKGAVLCNHLAYSNENIRYNPETKSYEVVDLSHDIPLSGADATAPVKSYKPNDYGIYNLNGNVSEMLSEKGKAAGGDWRSPGYDVRNESVKTYTNKNPTIGFRPVMTILSE
jgi:formylglycine-generating enzyme required for sulfatase activity